MSGQVGRGATDRRGNPEVTDPGQRGSKADALRRQPVGLRGQEHVASHEVVGEQLAPHFLDDADWPLTSQAFLALKHMRLEFIESYLQLPTLVVENNQLFGRMRDWVQEAYKQAAEFTTGKAILNESNQD